jgi:hypothetical protein
MARKKKTDAAAPGDAVSVVAHPRARRSIRRLRARAGLLGLVAVTYLSLRAGVPPFDAVLRGLAGGVVAHFVAWGAGIIAWRHLVMAELAAYRDAQEARRRELRKAAEQRAADALAANA